MRRLNTINLVYNEITPGEIEEEVGEKADRS